jgi:hypothetical protein
MRLKPRFLLRRKWASQDARRLIRRYGEGALQEALDRANGQAFPEYKSERHWLLVSEKIRSPYANQSLLGNISLFVTMMSAPRAPSEDIGRVKAVHAEKFEPSIDEKGPEPFAQDRDQSRLNPTP